VVGELDAESFRTLQRVEQEATPETVVEIDPRRCTGIDEFGFGSLVGLIRRGRAQAAHVQVRGAASAVMESLRRSGVERLVDLVAEPTDEDRPKPSDGVRSQ